MLGHDDDPNHIIHQMITMNVSEKTPAEDAILAWVLSLPTELDPALAATRLLNRYKDATLLENENASRTINFLKQTAEFPASRLASTRRGTRSRRKLHS